MFFVRVTRHINCMGNQVEDFTTKSAMSQKRRMSQKILQNKMLQNVFRKKQKQKNVCTAFELVMKSSSWLWGPFLGYNTNALALAGFANIYAITYKHCTQNAFCRNMYKRLSHINCMGNQLEDFTTNSKVALAFPTCAPYLWERLEISLIKSPIKVDANN